MPNLISDRMLIEDQIKELEEQLRRKRKQLLQVEKTPIEGQITIYQLIGDVPDVRLATA